MATANPQPTKTKPLIQRVEVRNFKCLRSVDVDLEQLTVLIGKNDTGKSSFLEAIQAVAFAFTGRAVDLTSKFTTGCRKEDFGVTAQVGDKRLTLAFDEQHGQRTNSKSVGKVPLQNAQAAYRLDPQLLRESAQVGSLGADPLPPRGKNLAAAIDRLPLSRMIKLQSELVKRIPTIQELVLRAHGTGSKEITFDLKSGGRVSATEMSDGAMLLLAYLTVMFDEHAPRLIMIEEPENGIHPKQLEYLIKSLSTLTEGENPIQIILTTHSPYVLDFVPKEAVRVFARDDDGNVTVKPFADLAGIADMLSSGFTLGEAWYNTDEDELIRRSGTS